MDIRNIRSIRWRMVNFWWIIVLLSVVIIGLVAFILTKRVTNAVTILEYMSYASVLLSITLSVFAILYTYTSNVQIQQQFEKINSAANRIQTTSDNLIETNTQLKDSLSTIMERLDNIDKKQEEIANNINEQPSSFPSMDINNTQGPA